MEDNSWYRTDGRYWQVENRKKILVGKEEMKEIS